MPSFPQIQKSANLDEKMPQPLRGYGMTLEGCGAVTL
jgi:hypothetical protein